MNDQLHKRTLWVSIRRLMEVGGAKLTNARILNDRTSSAASMFAR